jgi:mRNA interferase MazF
MNVSQIVTLDKSYLIDRVGKIPPKKLIELEEGLRLVLSL